MQATTATFSPDTRSGTVLLDNGAALSFGAEAFDHSGLRLLRSGQRVRIRVSGGRVVAMTLATFDLPE